MINFFVVALILSLPLIATFAYVPFAPAPLSIVKWENNNGDIKMTFAFAPVMAVSSVAIGLWLIGCFCFNPFAKLIFHPSQMMDKPKPVYHCGTCRLELTCVSRVANCERFVSILNQDSYCTTGEPC